MFSLEIFYLLICQVFHLKNNLLVKPAISNQGLEFSFEQLKWQMRKAAVSARMAGLSAIQF